jgi:hypothetical protein
MRVKVGAPHEGVPASIFRELFDQFDWEMLAAVSASLNQAFPSPGPMWDATGGLRGSIVAVKSRLHS